GGTSGHIGPLPGRDSDAARTHAATRGAGETRAAGLADLRLGYARPSADQTGYPTCRWPANFAVARQGLGEHARPNASQGPRDMVKDGLLEPQSPAMETHIPR